MDDRAHAHRAVLRRGGMEGVESLGSGRERTPHSTQTSITCRLLETSAYAVGYKRWLECTPREPLLPATYAKRK